MLPTDKKQRKETPICRGVLDYFPDAIAAVARVSFFGNQQHNPGEELHWSREKSADHADCIARHLLERDGFDDDGQWHAAKMAWRALAFLQILIEEEAEVPHPCCVDTIEEFLGMDDNPLIREPDDAPFPDGSSINDETDEELVDRLADYPAEGCMGDDIEDALTDEDDMRTQAELDASNALIAKELADALNLIPADEPLRLKEPMSMIDHPIFDGIEAGEAVPVDNPQDIIFETPDAFDCVAEYEKFCDAQAYGKSGYVEPLQLDKPVTYKGVPINHVPKLDGGHLDPVNVVGFETSTPTAYLAGPMTGIKDYNFPAFDAGKKVLEDLGYNVISPADMDRAHGIDENRGPISAEVMTDIIKRDVAAILSLDGKRGDIVVLLPGWENSKGAMAERLLARWHDLYVWEIGDLSSTGVGR